jgi:hypothetical protein
MPIEGSAGTLDIENATLRSNAIAVLTNLVTGNDRVRESGAPALEVYGDPSNGGNEARLEMVSNTATVSSSAFTRLTSNAGVLSIKTGTDASDNGTITFGGFANERLRITGNGNVGIGTADPGTALTVFSTSGTQMTLRSDSRYSTIFAVDDTGSSFFGNDRGAIRFSTGGDTSGSGSSEKMRILANGNVGIGTTTPAYPLHIQTTGDGDSVFNFVTDQRNDVNVYYRKIAYVNNNNGHVTIRGSMGSHSKSAGNGFIDIKFSVRDGFTALGSCYGTINNTNIIVKDNTINNRKDIYLVTGSYSLANLQITTTQGCGIFGDNENQPTSTAPSGDTTHDLKLNFNTFRVDDDGNVGIGTTNPNYKLHIEDATDPRILLENTETLLSQNQDIGSILFKQNDNSSYGTGIIGKIRMSSVIAPPQSTFYGASANMIFSVGNYAGDNANIDALTIRGNGNVGIGTANPIRHFVVAKTDNVASTPVMELMVNTSFDNPNPNPSLYRLLDFSTNADSGKRHCSINLLNYNNTGTGQYDITERLKTGLGFSVRNGGSVIENALSISYTGDVGINDSTPSYTLDVNGTISANNVSPSDDRIKYNEQNVSNALTLISQLNPQKYEKIMERPNPTEGTWIPTDEEWENVKEDYKYGDEFGFIAQDVRAVPELAFLVHGEETRSDTKTSSPEEYSNLTTEEQLTYTTSYTYESNTITQEEYSNLSPEEQGLYSTQYTKQIETQTPLALNYQGLFVVAIGAIKELKAKNDDLEARITALESA